MHLRADKPSLFQLVPLARHHRKHPTRSEAMLWTALRGRRLGPHFRRQHPIDAFIVDFCSIGHQLVIEIDGSIHRDAEHAARDAARQRALEALGWRVLRLDAELVESNLAAALARIRAALR
jgi:very-short-patch-repair endonuclease